MLRVLCVMKSGGDFRVEHVASLKTNVARHLHVPHKFTCLTDRPRMVGEVCDVVELRHKLPGWWSKFELFRVVGPCLYFDLDTVAVRDLGPYVPQEKDTLYTLERFRFPGDIASGIMAWDGDMAEILREYLTRNYFVEDGQGDQVVIQRIVEKLGIPHRFFPREITASYKNHYRDKRLPMPEDVRAVAFHGKPRPWEVAAIEPMVMA